MIKLISSSGTRHCDGITRREALRIGALGLGGLTLPHLLSLQATAAPSGKAKAKSVILLFLSGGPSQLDTFDMKPDAPSEIRGTFEPVATNVPGIHICEHLPRTARHADKLALIRSVCHRTGSHPAGAYWMMVGHPIARPARDAAFMSRADRPHPGSALTKVLGPVGDVPSFVMVPEAIQPNGPERAGQHAGFLGPAYDPYRINSDPNLPDFSPGAVALANDVSTRRFRARRALYDALNQPFQNVATSGAGGQMTAYYEQAFDLVTSKAVQQAFDISRESPQTIDRYGRHVFGQSVLLARRMVEAGVRLVHVNWVRHDGGKGGQGYDSHRDHLEWSKTELMPPTDAALASLLEDLHDRGLLDETLVVVMGEFGRTPRFNKNAGRDHWPYCFSVAMAGGGIRGGTVYGASDRIAAYPTADPVSPGNILATIYSAMGVDPQTEIYDLQSRPHRLADDPPIKALLS